MIGGITIEKKRGKLAGFYSFLARNRVDGAIKLKEVSNKEICSKFLETAESYKIHGRLCAWGKGVGRGEERGGIRIIER